MNLGNMRMNNAEKPEIAGHKKIVQADRGSLGGCSQPDRCKEKSTPVLVWFLLYN